jgi:thiol-disulfide isomerase/thioredoxin
MNSLLSLVMLCQLTASDIESPREWAARMQRECGAKVAGEKSMVVVESTAIEWDTYEDAYAAHVENGRPLVVLVSASWCGPCQALKAAIEKEAITGANYCYVDVDESPKTVALLGFTGRFNIPQLKIYYAAPLTANHEHWTGEPLAKERPRLFGAIRKAVQLTPPKEKDL